jgi:uncharacterized protein
MTTRIVIDTNLWVSMVITNRFVKLDALLDSGSLTILYDKPLIEEIAEVLLRPRILKYISREDVQNILDFITDNGTLVSTTSTVSVCRDDEDNFLLALAKDGRADVIITGDKDLLVLRTFWKIPIMTFAEFINRQSNL